MAEKVGNQKRAFEVLTTETNTEFIAVRNQVVETATDVLTQIKESYLPQYEK